ncbi:MAG: hypothetical protein FWD66_05300, partial [Paludibacter sp.]|nr:hypothetical protein [Paludibacter sp.]
MRKFTFLMALALIFSAANAQQMRKESSSNGMQKFSKTKVMQSAQQLSREQMHQMRTLNLARNGQIMPVKAPGDVKFSEGFETYNYDMPPTGGWTNYATTTAQTPWWVDDGYNSDLEPYEGYQFVVNLWDYENDRDAWIFSPAISLTSGVTYRITFWT